MVRSARVLVTGGAGFIGSHLCERLLEFNNEVVVIDDLSTGRVSNVERLLSNESFEMIHEDILDIEEIDAVDLVMNLACPASPVQYQKQPFQTMMTNVEGTYILLNAAHQFDATFLQASTSEIYGDPLEHPQRESYTGNVNTLGPRSCYDEGKRAAETLCADFNRVYDMDIKIARIFNTYGPNMRHDDGRVVSNFIYQALLGRPLTVYGKGEQTRSLCYVSDTVDALMKMADSDDGMLVLNIGNPHEISMIELAEKVLAKTKSNSKIEFLPLPEDDPMRRKPDITKAKDAIDWQPKVNLDDGLDQTIEYFRKTTQCLQ
jgi:UDP-glucuronate decarboxylase